MRDRIFLNYRKDDTQQVARRLADRLKRRFGEQLVFLDEDDIPVGDFWKPTIDEALSKSFVLLALIGSKWIDAKNEHGNRRLDDPKDVVRREIETALRSGISVITVSVNDTPIPKEHNLPESLREMLAPQGDRIRFDDLAHNTFDDDIDRIVRNVSRIWSLRKPVGKDGIMTIKGHGRQSNTLIEVTRKLLTNAEVSPMITRRLVPDPFLRQDPQADIRDYASESPISIYLPYVEIINWCEQLAKNIKPEIEVKADLRGEFPLKSWGPGDGDRIREQALADFCKSKPMTFDGPTVRIESAIPCESKLYLSIQKAKYFDQLRSNLILDYKYKTQTGAQLTLRDILRQEFGASLPPLEDRRMANTLGIAALIMVRSDDDFTPYLVSRSRDVAVFNYGGEWHCTASGVAELPSDKDREVFFYKDSMLKELDEEVGILEHELDALEPVAFCREMTRGGKPQMFFLGITSLDRPILAEKLKEARKRSKNQNMIVENTAMPLLRRPANLSNEEALAMFYKKGFTIEAAACLHYFFKYRALVMNIKE